MYTKKKKGNNVELGKRLALRQNEPELREFEQKLRDALTLKEQICQMKEKRHKIIQKEIQRRQEHEGLTKILMEKKDLENILKQKNATKKLEHAEILQLQMQLQQHILKRNKEKLHKEELELEELEEEILHLKLREKENKTNTAALLKYEANLHKKIKEIKDHKSKLTLLEEEKNIKEYEKLKNERELEQINIFKTKMKRKEETFQKIASIILIQEKTSQEREKLIKELRDHEYIMSQSKNNSNNAAKNPFRKELMTILSKQIDLQAEYEKRLKEEEQKFRQQLLDQAKEEEELEIENRKIFKLINEKYYFDIQLQMEINKKRSEEQKKHMESASEYINQYNKEKLKIINEEKFAMLQEYNIIEDLDSI